MYFLQKTDYALKDTNNFKTKGWKKIFHTNSNQKRAQITILVTDKID